jgi:hypothetical protein
VTADQRRRCHEDSSAFSPSRTPTRLESQTKVKLEHAEVEGIVPSSRGLMTHSIPTAGREKVTENAPGRACEGRARKAREISARAR